MNFPGTVGLEGTVDFPGIVDALLAWYDRHARRLPWRDDPSPYHVLVSEFMLQQTQVATVIPYYERFIARFPTFAALAAASEDEVLRLWEGLGYYRRARNLWRLAQAVVSDYGGELPRDVAALRQLPGVGEYTAGAVASIAYGQAVPAVDGNGRRVLARWLHVTDPVDRVEGRRAIEAGAYALVRHVPPGRAGDFTQAVMELGALVCLPRAPRCDGCPVAGRCLAFQEGDAEALPVRQSRAAPPPEVDLAALLVVHDPSAVPKGAGGAGQEGPRVLLVRRPEDGLLGGMWALPTAEKGGVPLPLSEALDLFAEEGVTAAPFHQVVHTFSHRRWRLRGFAAVLTEEVDEHRWAVGLLTRMGWRADTDFRWAGGAERKALAVPRPFRRLLQRWEALERTPR